MKFLPNLTRSERKFGLITFIICLLLLPGLLMLALPGYTNAQVNFTAYFITVGAGIYVLRRFLLRNLAIAVAHPFYCVYYAILGYLGFTVFSKLVSGIVYIAVPDFVNLNDESLSVMLGSEFGLMAITTAILAPIAEECLFRGILFRGIYDRSPSLAWTLSVGLFSVMHLVSFIGSYSPLELLLAFILYLPGGVALCVAYRRGGSIFSPILAHMIINGMALFTMTR